MTGDRKLELDGSLLWVAERPLETLHGEFRAQVFRNLATREIAVALLRGSLAGPEPLLSRVHSSCITSEAFGACDCDCAEQLDAALAAIGKEGRGVLFYLMQEGRGAGLTAKARDRMLVQASRERLSTFEAYDRLGLPPDPRRYDEVATMCRMLGIEAPLELLTNNPDKVVLLEREKVRVSATRPLQRATSPFNRHYLESKLRSGHALRGLEGEGARAEWPEPVVWFDPEALSDRSSIVYSACYWLPVRSDASGGSAWFRLHLYYDLSCPIASGSTGSERVVLSYRSHSSPRPDSPLLLRVQPEYVFERFSQRGDSARRSWDRTIRTFLAHGAGAAVFLPPEVAAGERAGQVDAVTLSLLAEHAQGRPCRLVCDSLSADLDRAVEAGLPGFGVQLGPPVHLGPPVQLAR